MNLSEKKYLADPFSHIYIEENAFSYELTKEILKKFPTSHIIKIKHYKDIFNRSNQNFLVQKYSKSLILAVNNGELLYPGARVCQSFGNENFYYTSNIMNCIYDCEYCYLQGMYPSGNMVIFVNVEDYFKKLSEVLKKGPAYVCISYDTDLLAMESITGLTHKWIEFTEAAPNLKIEIRTKSAYDTSCFKGCTERVIFAWTLSPDIITHNYEHMTPSLSSRIESVNKAISYGLSTRLCFDPMIYIQDYRKIYSDFYSTVFSNIDCNKIVDASLGLFRISASYMKAMRKKRTCAITSYPYTNINGICSYEQKKSDEMINFARLELLKYIPENKLFTD